MKTNITAKGFALNETIRETINEELTRVTKMLPDNVSFDIVLKKRKENECECSISIRNIGAFVRGEATVIGYKNDKERFDTIVISSIDQAVDDLKRKLRKLKTAIVDKKRKPESEKIECDENLEDEDLDYSNFEEMLANEKIKSKNIECEKHINATVMNSDEAIAQMESSGQDFYAFKDYNSDVNIVYKRNNGGYGMLKCS